MNNGPITTLLAMTGLLVATLSTNIAANIVAPANAFVNLAGSRDCYALILYSESLALKPQSLTEPFVKG
jgi:hypothetical protein